MPAFEGNTSSSAISTAYTIPVEIKSFSLVNKTGGAITANVSILYGSTNISIIPLNKSISANDYFSDTRRILIPTGYQIYVLVSGNCDYYFTLEQPSNVSP